jgi:hypothetical protein
MADGVDRQKHILDEVGRVRCAEAMAHPERAHERRDLVQQAFVGAAFAVLAAPHEFAPAAPGLFAAVGHLSA